MFTVDNIHKTGNFEIAIRYELLPMSSEWSDVRLKLIRDSRPEMADWCADSPMEEEFSFRIEPCTNISFQSVIKKFSNLISFFFSIFLDTSYTIIKPPVCLESNKKFTVEFLFALASYGAQRESASIFVDSVS